LFDNKETYLWGDAFLVSPITEAGVKSHKTTLPEGVWFDFWNGTRYQGGADVEVPVRLQTIPVLVRAGAFVPMTGDIKTSSDYSSEKLTLHYYADSSVAQSSGEMYEDDGESYGAIESGEYDLLKFAANNSESALSFDFSREGKGYSNMPASRHVQLQIHNWSAEPSSVSWQGQVLDGDHFTLDSAQKLLTVRIDWSEKNANLVIRK